MYLLYFWNQDPTRFDKKDDIPCIQLVIERKSMEMPITATYLKAKSYSEFKGDSVRYKLKHLILSSLTFYILIQPENLQGTLK